MNAQTVVLMIVISVFAIYQGWFYEPPYVASLRAECAAKGEKAEKRRNAVTIDLLPYPLANYHWACSGDRQPIYRY